MGQWPRVTTTGITDFSSMSLINIQEEYRSIIVSFYEPSLGHSAPTSPDPYSEKIFDLPEVEVGEMNASEKILDIIGDCGIGERVVKEEQKEGQASKKSTCLLYTSDAADE